MTRFHILLSISIFSLASCGINNTGSSNIAETDTLTTDTMTEAGSGIIGTMEIRDTITVGEPLTLKFTVFNRSDTAARFLKWSTPFEPLLSKYLDITDEDGTQVNYRGAMAKRAMPPSAESYITMKSGDSLVVNVNLLEGYAISRPSKYKIVYVGEGMSGINVRDSLYFIYR